MTGRDTSHAKDVFMSLKRCQLIHAKVRDTDSIKRDVKLQMLYYQKRQLLHETSNSKLN